MLRNNYILIGSAIALILLGILSSRLYIQLIENQEQQKALYLASNAAQSIQQNLVVALSAAKALSPIVDSAGNVRGFERIAPEVYAGYEGVASVQLAPKGIVEFVYPLEGNENVLGLNNFADPVRRQESVDVVKGGELSISGPLRLKQGYTGVIGRFPLYRGNAEDIFDRFWGFATVIVSLEKLLEATTLDELEQEGYQLRLSLLREGQQTDQAFYVSKFFSDKAENVSLSFTGLAKQWTLDIHPSDGWAPQTRSLVVYAATVLVGSLALWVIYLNLSRRQSQASQLQQAQKTQYLLSAANTLAELGSWEYDQDTQTFTLSDEVAKMLKVQNTTQGISPDVVGKSLNNLQWRSFVLRIQGLTTSMDAVRETVRSNDAEHAHVFEVHAVALSEVESGHGRVIGYFRDVTKRVQTNEKLEESLQQLEQVNRAKDLLFAVIAHDLRSPAGALHSIIEMISDDEIDNKQLDELKPLLFQSSRSIINLLDNLLSWSLSQRGTMQISAKPFDVRSVVQDVFDVVRFRAHQKKISLEMSIPHDHVQITSDQAVINTILRNLVSNAIKFTNSGGRVAVEVLEDPNQCVIMVKDDGIGMSSDQLQNLFNSEQMHTTPGTDLERGTGLGLKVCKDLAEKLQGSISVDSMPNRGTTFALRLPQKK